MKFRDLGIQYNVLKKEIDCNIQKVLSESDYIMGSHVIKLEKELAEYVGVRHCITCANGTDALMLALMAWKIKEGDAVFVPDFTFFASGEVVSILGATPVFVDVCEDTFNISSSALEKAIQQVIRKGRLIPKVVISVNLFGQAADYSKLREIADRYGIFILEDAAQGFGGKIGDNMACSFGDVATTSFFPAKPLGCYGDGGAIFTSVDDIASVIRSLRNHGSGKEKYDNIRIGMNSRLDTLQAAILLPKLRAFKEYELESINKIAWEYTFKLKDIVCTPVVREDYLSSWAQYTIKLKSQKQRSDLKEYLAEKGIPTMIYYPKGLHLQTAFRNLYTNEEDFTNSNKIAEQVLSLPIHPYMEKRDLDQVIESIRAFMQSEGE
jgi:dTDP-4-amino-4,6-dideoxygalactose transaminase